jgi:hypothetical protein
MPELTETVARRAAERVVAFRQATYVDVIPGAVVHVARGGVETAHNVGSRPYLEVIVELKDR